MATCYINVLLCHPVQTSCHTNVVSRNKHCQMLANLMSNAIMSATNRCIADKRDGHWLWVERSPFTRQPLELHWGRHCRRVAPKLHRQSVVPNCAKRQFRVGGLHVTQVCRPFGYHSLLDVHCYALIAEQIN